MHSENSTKLWLFLAAVAIGIGATFGPEIADGWASSFPGTSREDAAPAQLPVAETEHITGFRLGSIATGPIALRAEGLRTFSSSESKIDLGFWLVSSRATTAYPSIRIAFVNEDKQIIRTIVLSNTEYAHGTTLSSEPIALNLHRRGGERGWTVQPFYPGS